MALGRSNRHAAKSNAASNAVDSFGPKQAFVTSARSMKPVATAIGTSFGARTKDSVQMHPVAPTNALLLAENLPNATLIVYSDSSHAAQSQHAELFLEHVQLFLN